jgi:hypothetical protein
MTRSRGWSLGAPSKVPVRGENDLCHGRGAWRPGFSLAGRGVGCRELQGPGALGYPVGVVFWSLGVGGKTGLVGFAGEVVVYQDEHVVIGTVNHGYTCMELADVHCAAMALRVTGKENQRGLRKGEDFGPWFAEPSNNKLGPSARTM